MRKITLICALFFATIAGAQTRFGIKAGANLSTFTGKSIYDVDFRNGFQAGVFAEIKLAEKMFLQLDLMYSEQGSKINYTEPYDYQYSTLTYDENWKLSYINIPVMFKFYAYKGLFVEAGPQLGIFVDGKSKYTSSLQSPELGDFSITKSGTEKISNYFKSLDFAANLGVGYHITDHVFLNARYSLGLINIYDFPTTNELSSKMKGYNNVISLSAGYKF